MENTAYITLSRQVVLRSELDIIANNVANLSTPAYKAKTMTFSDEVQSAMGANDMSFVSSGGTSRNFDQGPLSATQNPLDFAIHGDGFFPVQTPDGVKYTRAGRFLLDFKGDLVTNQGFQVLGLGNQPINIPYNDGEILVARDGTISTASGTVGRFEIVTFENMESLKDEGNTLYASDSDPVPNPDADIEQGMVEDSNVNGILEMTKLIEVSRSYQSAQKLIDTEFELQRKAISAIVASA